MADTAVSDAFDLKRRLMDYRSSRVLHVLALLVLAVIVGAVASPYFLTLQNFKNVLIASSMEAIVAIGLTVVLVSGGIDLSVGSVVGMSSITLALVLDAGLPLWLAIAGCLVVGLITGLINGGLIAYANLNALITTLATMTIGRSVVFIMSGGYSFSAIPPGFKAAFNNEALLGLPNLVWLAIALVVLADLFLRHNVWMRKFAFLGGSEIGAIRAGIDTRRLKLAAYVICALLAAVTAIVTTARLGSAFPQTGSGLELRVITAVVVGGCSIYSGRGSVLGSILGVVLLNLSNVLVIMALSVYWQGVAAGIVLLIAILTDMVGKRGAR